MNFYQSLLPMQIKLFDVEDEPYNKEAFATAKDRIPEDHMFFIIQGTNNSVIEENMFDDDAYGNRVTEARRYRDGETGQILSLADVKTRLIGKVRMQGRKEDGCWWAKDIPVSEAAL